MSPLSLLDEVSSSCLGCGCWMRCHRRVSAVAAGRGVIVVSRLSLLDEVSSSCLGCGSTRHKIAARMPTLASRSFDCAVACAPK